MINDQIAGLEKDKLTLETQTLNMQDERLILETQVTNLKTESSQLVNEVAALGTQVSSLQTGTDELENENIRLETQVSTLQANVSGFQSIIGSLENNAQSLETQISSFQTEIVVLETEVTESHNIGYSEGYLQGVKDSTTDGFYLRNPTYAEVIDFVNTATTNENDYSETYNCYSFTSDFNEDAFQIGYRCGFVYIEFSGSAHAIASFNTIDRGIIYIEPQTDEIVTLTVGQIYDDQSSWGLIRFFGIIW